MTDFLVVGGSLVVQYGVPKHIDTMLFGDLTENLQLVLASPLRPCRLTITFGVELAQVVQVVYAVAVVLNRRGFATRWEPEMSDAQCSQVR